MSKGYVMSLAEDKDPVIAETLKLAQCLSTSGKFRLAADLVDSNESTGQRAKNLSFLKILVESALAEVETSALSKSHVETGT